MSNNTSEYSQRELVSAEGAGTISLVLSVVSIPGALLALFGLRLLFPAHDDLTSMLLEGVFGFLVFSAYLFMVFFSAYAYLFAKNCENPRRARFRATLSLLVTAGLWFVLFLLAAADGLYS